MPSPHSPETRCGICAGVKNPHDYSYVRQPDEDPDLNPFAYLQTKRVDMRVYLCPACDLGRQSNIVLGEN